MEHNRIQFQADETWQAMYAAESYLNENGYSYGPCCAGMPRGILKGDYNIAEWKNLTAVERKAVHGVITGEMRQGPVYITFYDGHKPEHSVIVE